MSAAIAHSHDLAAQMQEWTAQIEEIEAEKSSMEAAHRRRRSSASTDGSSHRSSRRDSGEMHATLAISYTDASHSHTHTHAPPSTAVGLPPAFSYQQHGPTGAPPPTAQAGAHHPRSMRQADLTAALASVALEQLGADDASHLPRSASASPAPVSPGGLRTYTETEDRLVLEGTEEEEEDEDAAQQAEDELRRQRRRASQRESRPSSRRRSHDPRSAAAAEFPEQRATSDSAFAASASSAAAATAASVYPIDTVEFSTTHLLPSLSSSVGRSNNRGSAPPPTAQSNGRSPPHQFAQLQQQSQGPLQHLSSARGAIAALPIGSGSLQIDGHLHVREGLHASSRRRSAGLPGLTPISAHALHLNGDRTPITPNSAVGMGSGAGPSIAGGSGSGRIPSQPSSGSATPVLRPAGSRARAAGRQVGQLLAPLPSEHTSDLTSSIGSGVLYDHTGASQPASGASSPRRSSRGSGGMLPQSPGSVSALSAARAARRRSLEGLAPLGGGMLGSSACAVSAASSDGPGHRSSGGLLPALSSASRDPSAPSSVHNSPGAPGASSSAGARERFLRPTTPYSNQASFEAVSKRRSLPPLGLSDVSERLHETARNAED